MQIIEVALMSGKGAVPSPAYTHGLIFCRAVTGKGWQNARAAVAV